MSARSWTDGARVAGRSDMLIRVVRHMQRKTFGFFMAPKRRSDGQAGVLAKATARAKEVAAARQDVSGSQIHGATRAVFEPHVNTRVTRPNRASIRHRGPEI